MDPDVLDYLEAHKEDLTLSFLEKAHAALVQLRASDPDKDFQQFIEELKHSQTELAELRIAKKEAEIKCQLMKNRFEVEMTSFNDVKIENIFKNSGAREYIKTMKEKNKVKEDLISHMKKELEQKRNDLVVWQNKFREAEEQCNVYWKAWKDTQIRLENFEAEKRAAQERAMNFTPASSVLNNNQVPPPPPIEIPSFEDIFRQQNWKKNTSAEGFEPSTSRSEVGCPTTGLYAPYQVKQ